MSISTLLRCIGEDTPVIVERWNDCDNDYDVIAQGSAEEVYHNSDAGLYDLYPISVHLVTRYSKDVDADKPHIQIDIEA